MFDLSYVQETRCTVSYDRTPKNEFQWSRSIFCACSCGNVCVETTSSPPVAGGTSIPSQIGQFELRVLLASPTLKGRVLGKGFAPEGPYFFWLRLVKICVISAGISVLQTKGMSKTCKQIYDTGEKIYQTLLVPGTWFVRVRDVIV